MMTMNFKSHVRQGITIALLTILVLPSVGFAQGTTTSPDANVCARIDEFSEKMTERLANQNTNYQTRVVERTAKLSQYRAMREQQLADVRTKWDANHDASLAKLGTRATTDTQKVAVVAFKTAVTNAISARRRAMDSVMSAFKAGVDQAVASRKSVMDNAAATFTSSVNAALAKARSSCASGGTAKIVRDTLAADLETARMKLESDIKVADKLGADKVGTVLGALGTTRRVALEKVNVDFKTALEKAKTDLK